MFHPPPHQRQRAQQPRWEAGNNNMQLQRLPEINEVGTFVIRSVNTFARRHKYITGWYILGLLLLGYMSIAGGGGSKLTYEQERTYNNIMNSIDLQAEYDATDEYWIKYQRYQATKGWFWSCDSICQRNKRSMEDAERKLNAIRNEGNARMSDAKAVAGITSELAVNEMTDSFWQYFTAGKRFAKRQTGWDIMWMMFRSVSRGRDETMAEYVVKILLHILLNFTMGLLSALLFFILGLWSIVRSYQPNPVIALCMFIMASAAASAMVFTYILAMYGAAAGGVYGIAKLAESSTRARIAEQQRQQRLHYD